MNIKDLCHTYDGPEFERGYVLKVTSLATFLGG